MRGILGHGAYLPRRRLDRADVAGFLSSAAGAGAGAAAGADRGTRSVASFDEDTTTMGVEAAALALTTTAAGARTLLFSTVTPAYLDKTNATAVHAALGLDPRVVAADTGGAVRSAVVALRCALEGGGTTLLVAADMRGGLPGSADELAEGDGAAALVVGEGQDPTPLLAEYLAGCSATDEFLDRWRIPGEDHSRHWEERFGEVRYVPLGESAWKGALAEAGLDPGAVDHLVLTGPHRRACRSLVRRLGVRDGVLVDDLAATVGWTGAAHPALLLSSVLDTASPGAVVALVSLADGADVLLFRVTEAAGAVQSPRPVAEQAAHGLPVSYARFLSWRGRLRTEPPRRPDPARPSASAAARSTAWKFGFVGSRDRSSGAVHLPPARVSMSGGAVDDMEPAPMARATGTIVTFTVDRMTYSQNPPVVFAVVDFDSGGRLPMELTDVDLDRVAVGDRVETTFRRLFTADGIHNYFWKARPVPG